MDLVLKAKVERRKRKLYFTLEEYQRFGEALRRAKQERRHSYPSLAVVWVLLTTGCRPGEVIRAKRSWAVLDDENPRIEVKSSGARASPARSGCSGFIRCNRRDAVNH